MKLDCNATMRSKLQVLSASIVLAISLSAAAGGADGPYGATPAKTKEYLDRLVSYYSGAVSGYDNEFLTLKNGTKFRISDNRAD